MAWHAHGGLNAMQPSAVAMKCAACGHDGVFTGIANCNDAGFAGGMAGIRICPNRDCRALAFVIHNGTAVLDQSPAPTIDFDASSLPPPILLSLEEAIRCHSVGAYRASALMVRRVLEELCADRGAREGRDLRVRLQGLGGSIVIPGELLEAADELRLLGNDAAHVEAKNYDGVGEHEASLAIELAKELLKAVYQYADLVARLRSLKRI